MESHQSFQNYLNTTSQPPRAAPPPIVKQPGCNPPNQFPSPGYYGQPPPNMAMGYGQPPPNMAMGYGLPPPYMAMGYGQPPPNMAMGYGQPPPNLVIGYGQPPPNMVMGYGQPPPDMAIGYGPPQFQALPPPAEPIPGVPTGLEPLIPLGYLFVKQQIEILEMTMGVETPNRYDVLTGNGQRIYLAAETTPALDLKYFGASRAFTIVMLDFFGRRVMILKREYFGSYCWEDMRMLVNLGDGSKLGMVLLKEVCCSCSLTEFYIMDENDVVVMVIKMQTTSGGCCNETSAVNFPITMVKDGTSLGIIRKTFAGFTQEYYTDADNFGVEFSQDLNVRWKGLLFASVFLIASCKSHNIRIGVSGSFGYKEGSWYLMRFDVSDGHGWSKSSKALQRTEKF